MEARVRPAQERDLPRLGAIYDRFVRESAITFDLEPRSPEALRAWYSQFAPTGRHRLLVVEEDGRVQGYAGSLRFRAKAAYDTSVETTVYLAPEAAGRGLGSRVYRALFDALRGEDLHRAYAGITLPNQRSVRLHERFGFVQVGLYREVGRKHGRYWDVAWYEKALDP